MEGEGPRMYEQTLPGTGARETVRQKKYKDRERDGWGEEKETS